MLLHNPVSYILMIQWVIIITAEATDKFKCIIKYLFGCHKRVPHEIFLRGQPIIFHVVGDPRKSESLVSVKRFEEISKGPSRRIHNKSEQQTSPALHSAWDCKHGQKVPFVAP